MELKLLRIGLRLPHASLIIAPLWNWNKIFRYMLMLQDAYNCTFMELKYGARMASHHQRGSYNCTFMELKSDCNLIDSLLRCLIIAPLWNWNWAAHKQALPSQNLIIAPLWNWNVCTTSSNAISHDL